MRIAEKEVNLQKKFIESEESEKNEIESVSRYNHML